GGPRPPAVERRRRVRRRAVAGDLIEVNAVEDGYQRARGATEDRLHIRGLPPHAGLLQHVEGRYAHAMPFRLIGQLLVAAESDDAHPLLRAPPLVHFDTDQRVGPHPLDLSPDRGKTIERTSSVG